MKDSYFKYEKKFMIVGAILVASTIIGCQAPMPKQDPFIKTKDVDFICASNGFWYKKTGTTKLEMMKQNGKYLPCVDERL